MKGNESVISRFHKCSKETQQNLELKYNGGEAHLPKAEYAPKSPVTSSWACPRAVRKLLCSSVISGNMGVGGAHWSPQVIPAKISLLKLLTGLTDTISTSVVPQFPRWMPVPSSHFTPWSSGFSSLHLSPKSPYFISASWPAAAQAGCLLATYQPQAGEHKKHREDRDRELLDPKDMNGEEQWHTDKLYLGSGRQALLCYYRSPGLQAKRPDLSSATSFQKRASHIPLPQPPFLKNEESEREYV